MALNLSTLTDSSTSAGILTDLAKSASNLDLVASLENRVSGGANATQTTASNQPRAHVPLGDGHLYLPGVSGNYASAPTSTDYDNLASFTTETEVSLTDWNDTSNAQALMARAYSWEIRVQDGGKILVVNRNSSGSQYNIISTASLGLTNGTLAKVRVMRDGYDWSFYKDDGSGFVQVGSTVTTAQNTNQVNTRPIEVGAYINGTNKPATGSFKRARLWDNASPDSTDPILDMSFTDGDHKASSFTCSTGQTVTINKSGNDPATIVRRPFLRFDGSASSFVGVFNESNTTGGYFFGVFSVNGDAGGSSGRVFNMKSSEDVAGYNSNRAFLWSLRNATTNNLAYYYNYNFRGIHSGKFDPSNGVILHEVKAVDGEQFSKVNDADLQSTSLGLSTLSSEDFYIGQNPGGSDKPAIDLEALYLFDETLTDEEATQVRDYLNAKSSIY